MADRDVDRNGEYAGRGGLGWENKEFGPVHVEVHVMKCHQNRSV